MASAHGQKRTLTQYAVFILTIDSLSIEMQGLVTPDGDDTPDLLLGRDSLARMGSVMSNKDAIMSVFGKVLPLHNDIEDALRNPSKFLPSASLIVAHNRCFEPHESPLVQI